MFVKHVGGGASKLRPEARCLSKSIKMPLSAAVCLTRDTKLHLFMYYPSKLGECNDNVETCVLHPYDNKNFIS